MLRATAGARRMATSTAGYMSNLIHHVDVKPLDNNLPANNVIGVYVGHSVDLGWGRVYGGQTMAQGLAACQQLAGADRSIHHFGCHFLAAGDPSLDIRFEAEALSNGRSFSAVHVRALQRASPILAMTASLQTPETGLEYHEGGLQPEWKCPEELVPLIDHMEPFLSKHAPERLVRLKSMFGEHSPFDIRPSEFVAPWDSTVRSDTHRAIWIRARGPLPDDAPIHERLLTYISDWVSWHVQPDIAHQSHGNV
jgi:acyl-CoA thioesterase-2